VHSNANTGAAMTMESTSAIAPTRIERLKT
jgi:hypothetical protein